MSKDRRSTGSPAFRVLSGLRPGDLVPTSLYVSDYADGTRPAWTVHSVEPLAPGSDSRVIVLVDPGNGVGALTLFGPERPAALWVVTQPNRTLRTKHYLLGDPPPNNQLMDFDQQGRHASKAAA